MHFSKRLASFTRDTNKTELPITLTFKDGTTAAADVLLGCDGVRSPIRSGMLDIAATELGQPELRKLAPAWYSGWVTHRTIIPMEDLDAEWAKEAPDGRKHPLHTESCLVRPVLPAAQGALPYYCNVARGAVQRQESRASLLPSPLMTA